MENKLEKKIKRLYKDKRGIEDSFQFLLKAFLIFAMFSMIIFIIVINMGNAYNKDSSKILGGMNVSGINNTINGMNSQSQTWRNTLGTNSSNIISQGIGVVTTALDSVSFIVFSMFTFIISPMTVLGSILSNVFGVPDWIISVLEAIVIITGIFGIIRLLKWGS